MFVLALISFAVWEVALFHLGQNVVAALPYLHRVGERPCMLADLVIVRSGILSAV
jgi:hypothetical protein